MNDHPPSSPSSSATPPSRSQPAPAPASTERANPADHAHRVDGADTARATKRRRVIVAVAVVAIVVIGAGLWASIGRRDTPLALYGNVDIRDVNVGFRVQGRLAQLMVDEGDVVHAGDTIARLDAAPFERRLREGEASAAALAARLALLKAGSRAEAVAQARANLLERQVELDNARRVFDRQTRLRGTGATSERVYDDALAQRDQAAARVKVAQEALRESLAGNRKEEIVEAQANAARADASLAQARLDLDDCVLKAPSDGIVMTRAVEPGAMLAAGATVYTLSLVTPVWARVYVSEPDVGKLAPGTAVRVTTDTRPDRPYRGHIGFVSPTAEFTPKTVETTDLRTSLVYRVRVVIDDADGTLRQGMPVTVTLAAPPAAAPAATPAAAAPRADAR